MKGEGTALSITIVCFLAIIMMACFTGGYMYKEEQVVIKYLDREIPIEVEKVVKEECSNDCIECQNNLNECWYLYNTKGCPECEICENFDAERASLLMSRDEAKAKESEYFNLYNECIKKLPFQSL